MTAKEALEEMIKELGEEAAVELFERSETEAKRPVLISAEAAKRQPILRGEPNIRGFLALIERGPVMTEEEWDEFAREFDADHPHRPLFS